MKQQFGRTLFPVCLHQGFKLPSDLTVTGWGFKFEGNNTDGSFSINELCLLCDYTLNLIIYFFGFKLKFASTGYRKQKR